VNDEDPAAQEMLKGCKARVLRCRVNDPADASVRLLSCSLHEMHLELRGPWGECQARLPIVGRYNLMNALQAVAICHEFGLTGEQLAEGLTAASAPPGRLQRVSGEQDNVVVLVDYAHTDDGLKNAIHAVRDAMKSSRHAGRLICIFGCGGDRDRTKRPRMGRVASQLADVVVITSDNPRTESPGAIIDEILTGIEPAQRSHVHIHADREEAIRSTIAAARSGDVVLVAGKGHETYQILPDGKGGTRRIDFDDCQVARDALSSRSRSEETGRSL
jgi:UDP-N-acetylmuramoyl-L-alanyl-D-glutamate--2,6-diaminopimelate ligase